MSDLIVVGGGLAGCEAAWQVAERGIDVTLYEMRPLQSTGAHVSSDLAELVCSNSLGSNLLDRAAGLLKEELRRVGSLLIRCADESALPAGGALAVDRTAFSRMVTAAIESHPRIKLIRQEVKEIPEQPAVIASGPLTSPSLSQAIQELTGSEYCYFYDAISPIVVADSIDMQIAFRSSRYGKGETEEGDYLNCPMDRETYEKFVDALINAERIPLRDFEREVEQGVKAGAGKFFEGCLPIEVLARRGRDALAFGPLRPVGLIDPRTGKRPYAVVQLRQDNLAGSLYNLVGFQTNLTYAEQKRVFRMIPGLERAEFARYGQMHRNTFIFSPVVLSPSLQCKTRPTLFFAGQITGVEGYAGNIATGWLAGVNAARMLQGKEPLVMPSVSMIGALCDYISRAAPKDFQPMKANFGLLPPLEVEGWKKDRRQRGLEYARRSLGAIEKLLAGAGERYIMGNVIKNNNCA